MITHNHQPAQSDEGAVLPLVLVISLVLGIVVAALATYATTTLRYGQTVERSADRLAAANAGMENVLEEIRKGSSVCTQTALASGAGGYTYQIADTVNGMSPEINCEVTGGDVTAVDAFAVIMTGEGQTGPLLRITNGGNSPQAQKVFDGPVYMATTPIDGTSLGFSATLTIDSGDLWYTTDVGQPSSPVCPAPTVSLPGQLTIGDGYNLKCIAEPWNVAFAGRRPPEPTIDSTSFPARSHTAPASTDALGCDVWLPGTYTSPPVLSNQSYNYFVSGDYYFENFGTWTTNNAFVLFGYPGAAGPSIDGFKSQDTFANNPCRDQWTFDTDQAGASIFLGGNSAIQIDQNSTFEVSGKARGPYNLGIHALETAGTPSTITGDGRIVSTGSGSNKQLSIQGFVWAPYAGFEFDLISNDAVGALTGGAVVAELSAGASANANNFLISVDTQPATANFAITSTAVDSRGGTTTVRSIIEYRTDTEYRLVSRRVLGLTPE
jgi:Tfp pilus assembly protein PilX